MRVNTKVSFAVLVCTGALTFTSCMSTAAEQQTDDSIKGMPTGISSSHPIDQKAICSTEELHVKSSVRVKDIVGMYRQPIDLPPHSAFPLDPKPSGYNYLAISEIAGNRLHVKLITKEIDGHECSLDNDAVLCGQRILITPNKEEKASLDRVKQTTPKLDVSSRSIQFSPNPDGTFTWGYPYCGSKGGLNQSFKRSSRDQKIDNTVFNQ